MSAPKRMFAVTGKDSVELFATMEEAEFHQQLNEDMDNVGPFIIEPVVILSPEVVLAVYDSLVELTGLIDRFREVYPDIPGQVPQDRARRALRLLNGTEAEPGAK